MFTGRNHYRRGGALIFTDGGNSSVPSAIEQLNEKLAQAKRTIHAIDQESNNGVLFEKRTQYNIEPRVARLRLIAEVNSVQKWLNAGVRSDTSFPVDRAIQKLDEALHEWDRARGLHMTKTQIIDDKRVKKSQPGARRPPASGSSN